MRKNRITRKIVPLSILLLATTLSFAVFSGVGFIAESNQRSPVHSSPSVPGTFTISASPTQFAFAKGSSGSSTITVTSFALTGTIMLTASVTSLVQNGPTTSMSPTSLHVDGNSTVTSTLTVSASSSTPAGHYDINVTAFKGAQVHTIFIDVAVTPILFAISDVENFTVFNVKTTGTLSLDSPSSSFTASGSVTTTEKNSAGTILFSNTFPISHLPLSSPSAGGYTGRFVLNLHGGFVSSDISLTLAAPTGSAPGGPATSVRVTKNPDINANGLVDQADYNSINATQGCHTGQQCYNSRYDLNADGVINATDLAIVSSLLGAPDYLADFSISAGQNPITISTGSSSASSLLTFNSIGGLTNNLTLTASVSPSGLTTSFNPSTASLATGTGSSTLTVTRTTSSVNGTYTVTVNAKTWFLQHPITITISLFTGFNVTNSPDDVAVPAGSSTSLTITVSSVNNFAGTVNLAAAVSSVGPTTSFGSTTLTLAAGSSASTTLTVSTTSGIQHGLYGITVTGTIGSESHSDTFDVAVTPLSFSINDNENFTGVNVKTTGTFTVDSPSNSLNLSGTATVVATNATTGAALFSKTYTISGYHFYYAANGGGYTAYFILNVQVSPYRLGLTVGPTLSGPTSTAPGSAVVTYLAVTRNVDINGDGTVNQPDLNIVLAAFDSVIGQPNYNPAADINADGQVNIVDAAYISLLFAATDFI